MSKFVFKDCAKTRDSYRLHEIDDKTEWKAHIKELMQERQYLSFTFLENIGGKWNT